RAMLEEGVELRRQLVQVRAEVMRLELAPDGADDFSQPQDLLGQRRFVRSFDKSAYFTAPMPTAWAICFRNASGRAAFFSVTTASARSSASLRRSLSLT